MGLAQQLDKLEALDARIKFHEAANLEKEVTNGINQLTIQLQEMEPLLATEGPRKAEWKA